MIEEIFQVVPLERVLQLYANEFMGVVRLPLTGAVKFDSWIEHDEVVFRVYREKQEKTHD
jgi:hypothetical protein